MRRLLMVSLFLGLSVGLALPLEGASDKPKRGGTLTMAVRRGPSLMNPMISTKSSEARVREIMFESLLGIDLKGNIQPNLAESWKISPDGKLITFKLRQGVKFHNGREMTAADAKFSMDYTMNPKNGAWGLSTLSVVDRVEVAGNYTLKVFLNNPSPGILYALTSIRSFSVIPEGSLKGGVRKATEYPPGTGPFKFVEWKRRRRVVFDRFDDYWGQKPFVDRVILRAISNAAVRFTALRAGDVDLIERAPYEWVNMVVKGKVKGIGFVKAKYAAFRSMDFNVVVPPFDDKKLRLAVAHAIDRSEILQAAYFGLGEPTDQKYPKGHSGYMNGVPSVSYDPEKAKALLKLTSYKGETIEVMLNQGEAAETEATVLQAQLRRIGMNLKLKVLDRGAALDARRRGKYTMKFAGGGFDVDPLEAYTGLKCEPERRTKRVRNEIGYCDSEMDKLLAKAAKEMDPGKRMNLLKRIVTKVNADVPKIYIGYAPRVFAYRDYVKGFTTNAEADFRPWGGGLNHVWLNK